MSDHIPTLADVCSAIAEGHLVAALEGSVYQVNALELRRYFNKSRPQPLISFSSNPASSCSDSSAWSNSDFCRSGL